MESREHESFVYTLVDVAATDPKAARDLLASNPALKKSRCLNGETALHFCAVENMIDAVKLLVELGIDINATNSFGDTVLMDAVTMENEAMVMLLLSLGANPDVPSESYESPLTRAAECGNEVIVRLLLNHGANPNFTVSAYFNPLSRALDQGHESIVRLLIESGANTQLQLKDSRPELRERLHRIMEEG